MIPDHLHSLHPDQRISFCLHKHWISYRLMENEEDPINY